MTMNVRITTRRNAPLMASVTVLDPETKKPYLHEYETYKWKDEFVQDFVLPKNGLLPILGGIASTIGFWYGHATGDVRYVTEVLSSESTPEQDSKKVRGWHVCDRCNKISFSLETDSEVKCECGTLLAAFG